MRLVLPLPVPPKMPTVAPLGMWMFTSFSTHSGLVSLYLKNTWSKSMLPSFTAASALALSSVMAGRSSRTSTIRLAQAMDLVIIMNIMETIIKDIKIWVI